MEISMDLAFLSRLLMLEIHPSRSMPESSQSTLFGVMLLPKICANNSSRLRNLEIIFDGTKLKGFEAVAPGILFSSSRAGLQVPPWSYPHLSWEADAEG
ncbi:hypothetical protein MRB53_021423 [Persea americana]|uniref:Uncharacterized protein n=1 Tax=Persea americana TaxID=3435 RepID=A0ACC2L4L1_PERAE|nr:hypothetical protein MRB53_021423 [Persea americana]